MMMSEVPTCHNSIFLNHSTEVSLTSSLKGSRCGFHQKTFLVGAVDMGWGESIRQTAPTDLCASLELLQLWEMDKTLKNKRAKI